MDTSKILADLRAQRERVNQAIAALEALDGAAVSRQKATTSTKASAPVATPKPVAKKRVISPEGRKRMAEAQQKRWAKKTKAAKTA
jgi:aspartate carbamoyltransferase catalytic subunit